MMRPFGSREQRPPSTLEELRAWIDRGSTRNLGEPPSSATVPGARWCAYCGRVLRRPLPFEKPNTCRDYPTLDHVVPRVHGGKNYANQVVACSDCNSKKGSLSLLQYLLRRRLMWRSDREEGPRVVVPRSHTEAQRQRRRERRLRQRAKRRKMPKKDPNASAKLFRVEKRSC